MYCKVQHIFVQKVENIFVQSTNNWNARLIFRDIQRINPDFYPIPIVVDHSKDFDRLVKVESGFLTLDDAISIYDKCGGFMHEDNPFREPHDVEFYEEHISIWRTKIIKLLNAHIIHLCDDEFYYIIMQAEDTGNVAGTIFAKEFDL